MSASLSAEQPRHRVASCEAREALALRLILAYMTDDPDERAFYTWAVLEESGLTSEQFEIAARTAREAGSWWIDSGQAEQGRQRITAKLDALTAVTA